MFTDNYYNFQNGVKAIVSNNNLYVTAPTGGSFKAITNNSASNITSGSDGGITIAQKALCVYNSFLLCGTGREDTVVKVDSATSPLYPCYLGINLANSNTPISSSDYQRLDPAFSSSYYSVSWTSGQYTITVTNGGSSDISFNTIQTFASMVDSGFYRWYLTAEWQFDTVTISPGVTKTFSIRHDQYQA